MSGPTRVAPALVYLLPRYDANSAEHTYHLEGFLRKLGSIIPLRVLVESVCGTLPDDFPGQPLRSRHVAIRFLEELMRFTIAGMRGTRAFYVHYSYTAAIAAAIAARLTGGRSYYWNCGMYAEFAPPPGAPISRRLREWGNRALLETCARWSTVLVTGTPRMADYYARHARIPRNKICVLPNFIDLERFGSMDRRAARATLGIPERETVLLYLHRVSPRKGAHYLPALATALAVRHGPLRLIVAGDGPYLPILRKQAEEAPSAVRFDFRGWVPNRDAPIFFHAADLFLMPSEEEGFPRVLLEAMAAGCPFIAFEVGGVMDIIASDQRDCIALVQDADDFSRRCGIALKDASLREKWAAAGKRQVNCFTEERILAAFKKMITGECLGWSTFTKPEDLT
jgi:glycosyltransferase involved in cell wall biosynthesis